MFTNWHEIDKHSDYTELTPRVRMVREKAGNRNGYVYRVEYKTNAADYEWKQSPHKPTTYASYDRAHNAALKLDQQINRELKGWNA